MKTIKITILLGIVFCAFSTVASDLTISDVVARQRWPWSQLVDIDYVLTCDGTQRADVVLTAQDGTTTLTLPIDSLSGDLSNVAPGMRRIIWDPGKTSYTNDQMLTQFSVKLVPTPVPLYMIVDLTKSVGTAGQIEYVYESDLTNGIWGAWARNVVTNRGLAIQSVIWTGVTTNDIYRTDKLALRRISKGTFKMGAGVPPTISTTLTKDFYVGVFEVTQSQWHQIMGVKPSLFNDAASWMYRPVEMVSYNNIRGSSAGAGWPASNALDPNSFMDLLRTQTGLKEFDLPTAAQWEYACRAETTTCFNDGDATANVSGANANINAWLDVLGRYTYNGGRLVGETITDPPADCGPINGTAIVGSYKPNAWGLYDMHGNVWEWCLDWDGTVQGGKDPVGADSDPTSRRVFLGGSWFSVADRVNSAARHRFGPSTTSKDIGLRLVRTLP